MNRGRRQRRVVEEGDKGEKGAKGGKWGWGNIALWSITGTGGTAAITGGGFTLAGFTSSGIAGGSAAAGIQSGIGSVITGSAFSILQSIGAHGYFAITGFAGLGILAIGGAGFGIKKLYSKYQKKNEKND